jgi:Arc/MetJ family transcription regulator
MTPDEANRIAEKGFSDARAFLTIALDQPTGSPLREEMRQAALEALSWANDDDVIDALYDQWADEQDAEDQCS